MRKQIGVVGLGLNNPYFYAPLLNELGADVNCVWDYTEENARAYAERFGCQVVSNFEHFPQVDGVLIDSRNCDHISLARPFLAKGIPVYLEKPLSSNVEEALAFLEEFKDAKAFSLSPLRLAPSYLKMQQDLLATGELPVRCHVTVYHTMRFFLENPVKRWHDQPEQSGGMLTDIGIHAVFFERLTLEVDYYNQRTKDMIFDVPLSYTTGFGSILKNVGEMENKGIEFLINANVLRNKDFSWDVRFTGTANKNKIIKLATEKPIENTLTIRKVGEAYNTFYMPEYAGVDPETGEAMWYKGQEGDEKTKNVNEAGQRIVGSADPKFYGGFGMNFKYKGFDFSFDTSFTLGNKVYNSGFAFDMQVGHYFLGPVSNYVYDNRWQKPGDITDVPKFVAGDNSGAETNSSRFLMNGSYLRMKSMVLGYTLPKNLMNKVAIDNLRVYISADNLFTITAKDFIGFDPQTRSTGMQSWAYPVPRNIMFGLNLSF